MDNNHYRGFIEACMSYGMDKNAADMLYKQAALGPFARGTARRVGRGAAKAVGVAETAGEWAGKARDYASRQARRAVTAVEDAANATGQAVRNAANDVKAGYREAVNEYRAARNLPPLPEPVAPAAAVSRFTFKKFFHPARALGLYIKKHPYASTVASGLLAAYLTNKANNAEDKKSKSKLPTLTPTEKLMYDRANSGMDLPGLGLDPRFFTGSYYDSYLYM